MMQTIESIVDEKGRVHLLEAVELKTVRRAFVTLLPEAKKTNSHSNEILQNLGEFLNVDLESPSGKIAENSKTAREKSPKDLED